MDHNMTDAVKFSVSEPGAPWSSTFGGTDPVLGKLDHTALNGGMPSEPAKPPFSEQLAGTSPYAIAGGVVFGAVFTLGALYAWNWYSNRRAARLELPEAIGGKVGPRAVNA
jgi:hypothetical protein